VKENWWDVVGGTKNFMCWGVLIVSTGMLCLSKISPDLWGTVMLGIVGGYIVGNVTATFANKKNVKTER
jgi:hypothetical protein